MTDPAGHPLNRVQATVPPALERVVRAGARAAKEVPGAVAVGGTVCAMYAHHRLSMNVDFVLPDLRGRFDEVREHMLDVPGWVEAGARAPVLLLGSLDGVEVGFRQLRRTAPLDSVAVPTPDGPLPVPTFEEILRTKAYLAYHRGAMRDFIDFAELSVLVPDGAAADALAAIDQSFAWQGQPSVLLGVAKALLRAQPADAETHGYETFRWLSPRLSSWESVRDRCRHIGRLLGERALGPGP